MASLNPCSAPTKRDRRAPAASNAASLPPDVLFDVLLRLPAKELCRIRAVCSSWRFLTSDPLFIRAHAARHPGPLFLVKYRDDQTHIHLMDLSGNVVKRIANPDGHQLLGTRLDLACVSTRRNSCHVLNPATGAAYTLPESPALGHANRENLHDPYTFFACGLVSSTGEYKVLRMFNRLEFDGFGQKQLFEVITLNGGASNAQWRARQSRDIFVEANNAVVVDGVVYFLMDCVYDVMMFAGVNTGIHPDCVASFDLGREEWRGDIQGPISSGLAMDSIDATDEYINIWHRLTLADVKGSLVLVYYRRVQSIIDLWFLTDFENDLWVKEYSIQTEFVIAGRTDVYIVKPLLVLDGGRLVIHLAPIGLLIICDPLTNSFAEVGIRHLDAVGMYTGSLLSLPDGEMV